MPPATHTPRCEARTSVAESYGILDAPVFFADESLRRLALKKPPYGYAGERPVRVKRFMANATRPPVQRFATCAVVGGSGELRRRPLGSEIDSHSAVFRANTAPVGGRWRRFTGTRVDWRVFSSAYWKGHYSHSEAPTQFLVVCDRPYVYSCQYHLFERHHRTSPALKP